jgi:hypothetical protein
VQTLAPEVCGVLWSSLLDRSIFLWFSAKTGMTLLSEHLLNVKKGRNSNLLFAELDCRKQTKITVSSIVDSNKTDRRERTFEAAALRSFARGLKKRAASQN